RPSSSTWLWNSRPRRRAARLCGDADYDRSADAREPGSPCPFASALLASLRSRLPSFTQHFVATVPIGIWRVFFEFPADFEVARGGPVLCHLFGGEESRRRLK